MSLALLFPGQGSQYVGMGRSLACDYPEAARVFEEADDVLGFSISKLAWEGPEEDLVLTKNAQPAMLVHSTAVYRVIQDRLGEVGLAAGHSLGEFSAHVAAGTLDFPAAVTTVRLRGGLMYDAGVERPGSMAAVIGLDDEAVVSVCKQAEEEAGVCVPANFNAPGQVVISGDLSGVERAMDLAAELGAKRVVRLSVSGAFHSPLMEPAAVEFEPWLEQQSFHDPGFPHHCECHREAGIDRRRCKGVIGAATHHSRTVGGVCPPYGRVRCGPIPRNRARVGSTWTESEDRKAPPVRISW